MKQKNQRIVSFENIIVIKNNYGRTVGVGINHTCSWVGNERVGLPRRAFGVDLLE